MKYHLDIWLWCLRRGKLTLGSLDTTAYNQGEAPREQLTQHPSASQQEASKMFRVKDECNQINFLQRGKDAVLGQSYVH